MTLICSKTWHFQHFTQEKGGCKSRTRGERRECVLPSFLTGSLTQAWPFHLSHKIKTRYSPQGTHLSKVKVLKSGLTLGKFSFGNRKSASVINKSGQNYVQIHPYYFNESDSSDNFEVRFCRKAMSNTYLACCTQPLGDKFGEIEFNFC